MTSSGRIGAAGLLMVILAATACGPRTTFPPPSSCVTPGPSATPCAAEPTVPVMTVPVNPPIVTWPPSPSPAPTLTPEFPPAQFAEWARSGLPDPAPTLRGAFPIGIFMVEERLIAVGTVIHSCCTGSDPRKHRGVIWTSRDGLSWWLHDPVASLDRATIEDVVYDGSRLVAVGRYAGPGDVDPEWRGEPTTWTSTDGLNWTRSTGLAPTLIASGPDGFVGVRADPDTGTAQFLESDDGLTWTATSSQLPVEIRQVAVDPTGHALAIGIVPGEPGPDGEPYYDTVVTRSDDGRAWGPLELFAAAAYPPYGRRTLVADDLGFVAVVTDMRTGSHGLWRLTMTGHTRIPLVTPFDEEAWELVTTPGVVMMSRHENGRRVVWISFDDGVSWGRITSGSALGPSVEQLAGAVVAEDRLIIVGWRSGEPFHALPVAWVADR